MDDEVLEEFITESFEALDELEPLVVGLADGGESGDALNAIFRHLHSIKGTASFVDLPKLTRVAHAAENLVDELRHESLHVTAHRIDLLCKAIDVIRVALTDLSSGFGEDRYEKRAIELADVLDNETNRPSTRREEHHQPSAPTKSANPTPQIVMAGREYPPDSTDVDEPRSSSLDGVLNMPELVEKFVAESEEQIESIELTLLSWERSEATVEMLGEAFRAMHSFKGNCGIMGLSDMEDLTHNMESTFSEWKSGKSAPKQVQVTAILSVLDVLRRALERLPAGKGRIRDKNRLLSALNATSQPPRPMENELPKVAAPPRSTEGKLGRPTDEMEPVAVDRTANSIRVDTRKLDEMMNLVGELIIAETTVTHNPDLEGFEFENFQKAALNLNRITRQLQDVTMQARMVPIEGTFRKMIRLVRDVSQKQGKKVNLVTSGEETEVDKSVVETIADPLVHLIRNGIDHGLEDNEQRTQLGKPKVGQLQLAAHHQGGEVWISITDDGRGIDPDKVLDSAIKKGIADPDKTYLRDDILHMIFAPGFSTAARVTDISGRGVGMDVVKRNIERVNGRIDIDTTTGRGTTFTLRIPLTLAIIEGMLVRVGQSFYTIPLLSIRESVKASWDTLTVTSDGQQMLRLRKRHYPVTKLGDLFSTANACKSIEQGILVIVESEGQQACVLVDEVVGQRQTVIKPLPDYLRHVRTLSGCSILHNGDISLILDVDSLVRSSQRNAA